VIRFVIFFFFNQPMAVQRKLPTKICEFSGPIFSKIFKAFSCVFCLLKVVNLTFIFRFTVQTNAHSQKVSCLDIGETGRVLVTGGHDRLVNLFAIGNDKPIQVSREMIQLCEEKR
jgi:WD40 repeat protein